MGPKARHRSTSETVYSEPLDVVGTPPPTTLNPRVAFHSKTGRVYVFGGEKPESEIAKDNWPIVVRNTVHFLSADETGRLSWTGPMASDERDIKDFDLESINLPTGVLPRSEHVWVPAGHPDFLMAHGGNFRDSHGVSFIDQGPLADWLAFDTRTSLWTELQSPIDPFDWHADGPIPKEVFSRFSMMEAHGAGLDPVTGRVLLFMSFNIDVIHPDSADGLPGFVLETKGEPSGWTYHALETKGQAPSFRASYSVVVVGRRLIVFGGIFKSKYPDDVSVLDLDTLHWSTLETTGDKPSGRVLHSAIALDDKRMLIVGGRDRFARKSRSLNDEAYLLNVNNANWEKLSAPANIPPDASWVGLGSPGNVRVLALGGDTDGFPVSEYKL